jgi:hypothetical protein
MIRIDNFAELIQRLYDQERQYAELIRRLYDQDR